MRKAENRKLKTEMNRGKVAAIGDFRFQLLALVSFDLSFSFQFSAFSFLRCVG
jgi:hypothetical protein